MTVAKSSKSQKPAKPYPTFPLNANTNGQWSKRIQGRLFNFGKWDDPESALERYKAHILNWHPEPTSQADHDGFTLRQGINNYLAILEDERDEGDISPEHFDGVRETLQDIVPNIIKNLNIPIDQLTPGHFRLLRKRYRTKQDGSEASPSTMLKHILVNNQFIMA